MRVFLTFIILFFVQDIFCTQPKIDSLINVLDKSVDNYQYYTNQKERRFVELRAEINPEKGVAYNYSIYQQLYNEYKSYKVDSAIRYALVKLDIARKLKDDRELCISQLDVAHIWGISGMYLESLKILQSFDKNLFPDLKVRYFDIYRSVLSYMADYAVDQEKSKYTAEIKAFRDSLLHLQDTTSCGYIIDKAYSLYNQGYEVDAFKQLLMYFPTIKDEKRNKAYIAYTIAALYNRKGDRKHEKYWLIITAINDLQSINKEYLSLSKLAFILYEEGDIDRAYKYIKRSLEDAIFCSSRIRTYGISKMLPIIDKAYQAQAQARQRQLIVSLVSISSLVLFLMMAFIVVYRQMRKLAIARNELNIANDELFAINHQIKSINNRLIDSNMIKEEYIGRYMDQCSTYIDKLDNYRRLLNKMATASKIDSLKNALKSNQFIDDELKQFYNNFDYTFLQLFPTFVKDFAALMIDDEYVQLKKGQALNTELRIAALIRLGITDGVRMSRFLRCSLSTIYNYRYKLKNKAKGSRDEFEEKVMKIGF